MNFRGALTVNTRWIALVFFFLSVNASAEPKTNDIEVAVGWSKPPYVNSADNSGFELDLARHVFAKMGYTFKPIYVPYGRSLSMLKNQKVQAVLTVSDTADVSGISLSDVYIEYQNVAVTLQARDIKLHQPKDLQQYVISAYQTASKNLGQEFALAAQKAPLYVELPDQQKQVAMLLNGNVSVAIMDVNIFAHLQALIEPSNQLTPVTVHHLFAPNHYRVGFLNEELRNRFNQALLEVQESAALKELVHKYSMYRDDTLLN